jgi:hypothetical protein
MKNVWLKRGAEIAQCLWNGLPKIWDGRTCVEHLRVHNYHWRQTEWIGWYFEHEATRLLTSALGGGRGPTYGHVDFDYQVNGLVLDFKAHVRKPRDGWVFLNDVSAVNTCIDEHGGVGWVIATGVATYDEDGTFKAWHDAMKGDESAYVVARRLRGAPSRRRKSAFLLTDIIVAVVRTRLDMLAVIDEKLFTSRMQAGQRNSDGSQRAAKYGLHASRVSEVVLGSRRSSALLIARAPI